MGAPFSSATGRILPPSRRSASRRSMRCPESSRDRILRSPVSSSGMAVVSMVARRENQPVCREGRLVPCSAAASAELSGHKPAHLVVTRPAQFPTRLQRGGGVTASCASVLMSRVRLLGRRSLRSVCGPKPAAVRFKAAFRAAGRPGEPLSTWRPASRARAGEPCLDANHHARSGPPGP